MQTLHDPQNTAESDEPQASGITAESRLATPPRTTRLAWLARWAGPIVGVLLFALYVVILARNDIDAAMGGGGLLRVPGGWKSVAVLLVLAAIAVAAVGVWERRRPIVHVRPWIAANRLPLAVCALTLFALLLRLYGITDNLPYTSNPDEPAVADRAIGILQTGDYNPHYFVYPNLYTYMQAAVYLPRFLSMVSSGAIERVDQIVPTDFYLWGRVLTALLGALTVPLVFVAGRRLYGTAVGLIAGAFIAVNSVHAVYSQVITTDVPATFFSALSLLAIAQLLPARFWRSDGAEGQNVGQEPAVGRYVFAGVAMGLAVGTKYNSALVVLPFLLAHFYAVSRMGGERLRRFLGWRLWAGLGAMVAAFLLTTPFAIFDLPSFLNDVASVISHYNFGHAGHEGNDNWRYYVEVFLQSDLLPTLLTLLGVVVAFVRHRKADLLLLAFPVVFYVSMSSYRVNFPRNMLPILPFTYILAAVPLVLGYRWLTGWMSRRRPGDWRRMSRVVPWALAALVLLLVLPETVAAVQRDYRQTQPDNRLRASQWLDSNTRPGTKLWLESDTPKLTPGRYMETHGDHVTDHDMAWYVANRYDYLIVSAGAYKPVVYDDPQSDPPLRDAYLRFFDENQSRMVVQFETNKVDHPGPTIRIYRTGYTPPASPADVRPVVPLNATFKELDPNGATVRLLGADLPADATPGAVLPVTLYWTADRALKANYTVFVHLVDAKGNRPAQLDVFPRSGTFPTSDWQANEVVVDEENLQLPANLPPGDYTVRVGLYLQSNGQAVGAFKMSGGPAGSSGDYVTLGPVKVAGK